MGAPPTPAPALPPELELPPESATTFSVTELQARGAVQAANRTRLRKEDSTEGERCKACALAKPAKPRVRCDSAPVG